MKLVNKIGMLLVKYGAQKAVDLMAESGVDALDFTFPDEHYQKLPTEKSFYTELKKYAEDKGLSFCQAHAPAPSSYRDKAQSERKFSDIVSTMERASFLGVEHIVVHPCQHLYYVEEGVPEILFDYNMDFFRRLIPYAEEYNIKVAIENMWQYPGMVSHSTCSRPAEMIRYHDELNSDSIVCCLDIGHALLVRENPQDFIRALGKNRLGCMHVHDVDGIHDSHTLPYFGVAKWGKIMQALADIDYQGNLTFEACGFYQDKPEELLPQYLKMMEETGRHLIQLFEKAKDGNLR